MNFLSELGGHFESSCSATPQWNSFYRKAQNFFRKAIAGLGTDLKMSKGHFYFSGFFTAASGQGYYFSISDVRFFPEKRILLRTAENYRDYTGGANHYLPLDGNFRENLKKFLFGQWREMKRA